MYLNNSIKSEILHPAQGDKIIVCLEPGIESYWVTLDLIKKYIKNPIIVYVGDDNSVHKFYNYVHNMTDFKIKICQKLSDINDSTILSIEYNHMYQFVINGRLNWSDVSLLIIEDLQHIHKNRDLFNLVLCYHHYLLKKPPFFAICSMSFKSPVTPVMVQNLFNVFNNELCYKFIVGLRMSENIQEILVEYEHQEKNEILDKIEFDLKTVDKFIEMCNYKPYELGSSVMPNLKERINLILNSFMNLIHSMGLWCAEKSLIYYLEIIEKMKLCTVKKEKQYLLLNLVRTLIIKISNLCHDKCTSDISSILNNSSPKILRTIEILKMNSSINNKALILVQDDIKIKLLHYLFKDLNKCDIDFKYESQIYDRKYMPSNLTLAKISSIKNLVLPKFNLIIEYDEINDFDNYISSKCKLDNNGIYVKLIEKSKNRELFLQFCNFSSAEKLFLEYDFKQEVNEKTRQDLEPLFSYCLKLPSDSYTQLEPCLKINEESGKFTSKIVFPPNSHKNDIISQPMEQKEDSIKMACMTACSILCKNNPDIKFENIEKPKNIIKTASCFKNCRPVPGQAILYIINIQNISNLGILTTKNIPEISPLNLGTEENQIFMYFIPQYIQLDENDIKKVDNFMILLSQVCEYYQHFYPFNTDNSFMIVPVKKNNIDWDLLESNAINLLNIISDENYKDIVFSPIYSPNQIFCIKEIRKDITLETKPEGTQYSSIKNYFEQKFNVEIKHKQPLIYAKKIYGLKSKNGKYNEILVPELCKVHSVPGSIMKHAVFLPMALYNLNARLLSFEIKLMIYRDVDLGNLDSDYQICNIQNSQSTLNFNDDSEKMSTLSRYVENGKNYYCSNSESDDEYFDENRDFLTHITANFVQSIENILDIEKNIQNLIQIQYNHDIPNKFKEKTLEEIISDQISDQIYIRSNQPFIITFMEKKNVKKYINRIQNFTLDINEILKVKKKEYDEILILEDLKKISLINNPGPDLQLINIAMTLNKSNSIQILGFSFLTSAVAMYLFSMDQNHIGILEDRLKNIIRDENLYNLAQKNGLRSRMMTMFDQFFWARQETHSNIADCVKKLIGTYVVECGQRGGFILITWIGIDVLPKYVKPALLGSNQRCIGSYPICGNTQTILGILEPPNGPKLRDLSQDDILDINETISKVEDILQYSFKTKTFLVQSMTHVSCYFLNDCSQRLSFLGDKVLNYIITQYLYDRFKNMTTLEYLLSVIIQDEFYAFLTVKNGFHKYYKTMSHQLNKAINEYVMEVEKNNFQLDEEFYHTDGNEDNEIIQIISSIFKSVAASIFCDSDYSFSTLWTVIYKIIKIELDQFIKQMEYSPVKKLIELYPGKIKFRNNSFKFGLKCVEVEIIGKGIFKGLGLNYREAKLKAANLALNKLKKA